MDRRAGELAVGKLDAMLARGRDHEGEKFSADLMAEAARAAVNAEDDVALKEAEGRGDVEVDELRDMLNFQIMIAGAERAHFFALPFLGAVGNFIGPGAWNTAVFFDSLQIRRGAIAPFNRPLRAAREHRMHFFFVQA